MENIDLKKYEYPIEVVNATLVEQIISHYKKVYNDKWENNIPSELKIFINEYGNTENGYMWHNQLIKQFRNTKTLTKEDFKGWIEVLPDGYLKAEIKTLYKREFGYK